MTLPAGDRCPEVITYTVKDRDGLIIGQGLASEDLAKDRVRKWFGDYLKGPVTIERVVYVAFRDRQTIGTYTEAP